MTTAPLGLTSAEARERLLRFGARRLQPSRETAAFALFFRQLTSPIILILIGAALLSMFLADVSDALMILFIVLASACLSFWQEFQASNAVEKLRAIVMIVFGTLSSVFDYLTFAALLSLGATPDSIPHRMVYRIDRFGVTRRARGEKPTRIFSKPAEQAPHDRNRSNDRDHIHHSASAACLGPRLRADAGALLSDRDRNCPRLHGIGGSDEALLLSTR